MSQYHTPFANLQTAPAVLHTLAHTMKRDNCATGSTVWSVAYSNQAPGVDLFASQDSKAVVVFQQGEVVFSANRLGEVQFYTPGTWEQAVAQLVGEATEAGYALALPQDAHTPSPWLDAIEATMEPWELAA